MGNISDLTQAQVYDAILTALGPFAVFAFVLGSFGTPRFRSDSDLDLAVYFNPHSDYKLRSQIVSNLSDQFGCDIDLVDLNGVDIIFARQALETGRLLFCKNPAALLSWKVRVLSEYPDFKFSRKIIEDNILRKKKSV